MQGRVVTRPCMVEVYCQVFATRSTTVTSALFSLRDRPGGRGDPKSMRANDTTIERRKVFEEEAIPHLQEIYRSARGLIGRGAEVSEATDLVQEVYAQAWSSFDSYRPGTNCRAWLYSILMNKARHVFRKRKSARVIPFRDHPDQEIAEKIPSEPVVPTDITDEEVLDALDRLSNEHREIILLVDVRGFPYREAAEMLETPIGTVMSRLSRARAQLRGDLAAAAADLGLDTSRADTKKR